MYRPLYKNKYLQLQIQKKASLIKTEEDIYVDRNIIIYKLDSGCVNIAYTLVFTSFSRSLNLTTILYQVYSTQV